MKFLITGIGGFIGTNLALALSRSGAEVVGIDVPKSLERTELKSASNIELAVADIRDYSSLIKLGDKFDCIIHLAALAAPKQCDENPSLAFDVNVHGTHNVLKFALNSGASRFIFPSTAHVYGISPKYIPTDESHPLALQNTYTTTKILGESLCRLFFENHALSYLTLRLFNVYGPGQSLDYFIPATIMKAKEGRIALRGAEVTKDFVFVSDLMSAFRASIESEYVGEINIGTGVQTKLKTVASYIANKMGAELSIDNAFDEGPTFMQCDPTRANRALHWRPTVKLEEGLDRTIELFGTDKR